MTLEEYQRLAARTITKGMNFNDMENHALSGLVSEVGELHGLYQKLYQGHEWDSEHAKKRDRRHSVVRC